MSARGLLLLLSVILTLTGPFDWNAVGPPQALAQVQQDLPEINYEQWELEASRAEEVLKSDRTSDKVFEAVRAGLVVWRSKFTQAQNENASQIDTLRSQIAALGEVPPEGTPEAPEIAQRRKDLHTQLAKLQAPGIAAVEAFRRAEGLIRQIDTEVRARKADALLQMLPSPLNPANWPAGAAVLTQGLKTLGIEIRDAWLNPELRTELKHNALATVMYLAVAFVLMGRGPVVMERLTARLRSSVSKNGQSIFAGLVSLGQVVVPVVGMFLLVAAIFQTGMTGTRSSALVAALPRAAFLFFAARWLGAMLFSPPAPNGLNLVERPVEARFHANMIGLVLALEEFRVAFATEVRPPLSQAAQAVWEAPLVCLVAVTLFRLGMLLRDRPEESHGEGEAKLFRGRLLRLIGNATVAVAVISPVLATIGYVNAANALVWPTVHSLGLLALMILLQRFFTDVYLIVTGSGEEGREALIPVLAALLIAIASVPVFALIWGARPADLTETWTRFSEGVTLGDTRISPTILVTFVVVFTLGFMATRLVKGALKTSVLPRTRLDRGAQNALIAGVGYLGIFLSIIAAVSAAGLDLSSLAIVAGALSVGIGFGLKTIAENFISGIILLVERPIAEGDTIEVGGKTGVVKAISVRSTLIETGDRTVVVVPNAELVSSMVTNWTHGNLTGRVVLPVAVAIGSDTRKVQSILKELAEEQPLVMLDPAPQAYFVGVGPDSLNFEIRAILADVSFAVEVRSEILHQINARFAEEGIEYPRAMREVRLRRVTAASERAAVVAAKGDAKPEERPAAAHEVYNNPDDDGDPS